MKKQKMVGEDKLPIMEIKDKEHYPLTQIREGLYIEGYWRAYPSHTNSPYPFPLATDKSVDSNFLEKLELLTTRNAIETAFFGWSECRLCKEPNGSREYALWKDKSAVFRYPQGLIHYYKVHHVQPSREFYDFIMNLEPLPPKPLPVPMTEEEKLRHKLDCDIQTTFAFQILEQIVTDSAKAMIDSEPPESIQQKVSALQSFTTEKDPKEPDINVFHENLPEPKYVASVEQVD